MDSLLEFSSSLEDLERVTFSLMSLSSVDAEALGVLLVESDFIVVLCCLCIVYIF
jgi:hypothetical protein